MKVLISGAGIAGPALAWWLDRYGFEVTIVEKGPRLRSGGYIIDFWGTGYDVAERMGLIGDLYAKGYVVREVREVDSGGRRIAGFSADVFKRVTHGRYVSLLRGDLAASIFACIEGRVEIVFDDSLSNVKQSLERVHVTFESGAERDFDLVIGADGLHSRVREITFGPDSRFETYLGYKVAAFHADSYTPRDELAYVTYTRVHQQVARFAMRGNRTVFLLTFRDQTPDLPATREAQEDLLWRRFGDSGWECPCILKALETAETLYFDRVSQIRITESDGSWSQGRVCLVGDAAFCVSLLAGQGSSLAMAAAYILAGELHSARGDYAAAFARYQNLFAPLVVRKQKSALRFAGFFAPESRFSLFFRNQVMNLFRLPGLADLVLGADLADRIALPDY